MRTALDQLGVRKRFWYYGSAEFSLADDHTQVRYGGTVAVLYNPGGSAGIFQDYCSGIIGNSGYKAIPLFGDWYEIRSVKC